MAHVLGKWNQLTNTAFDYKEPERPKERERESARDGGIFLFVCFYYPLFALLLVDGWQNHRIYANETNELW